MTDLAPLDRPPSPVIGNDTPRREPVGRVVGGSLAAGLVGALVLTLGVFAGAREHVISGSALLAFAAGWALLAALSSRFTSQPQTWARVPAVAMALGGALLVVARPGDRALDAAGWVWPPVALGLAGYVLVQVRRNLRGRVRWLLAPVVGAMILGSIGGMAETVVRSRDRSEYPAPGTRYDVGGHRLHLSCVGSGSPTVVLENGLGGLSVLWTRVSDAVRATTRVCAYDRAGQGWSDDVDTPQDGVAVAADLHALLAVAGESGPFVLVGHSAGGLYALVYAARYPDEVAGMVLLDSMTPHQFTALPDFPAEYSMMRRGLGVLPSLTRLGAAQLLPASMFTSLPEASASQVRAFATSPRQMRNMRDEQSRYPQVVDQAKALTTLGGMPLVVLTATETLHGTRGWGDAQDGLAELSANSRHRVVEATHEGVVDAEHGSAASVVAITDVVQSVRTGDAVANR